MKAEEKRATEVGCHTDSLAMNLGKLQEMVRDREAWHTAVDGIVTS